MIISTLPRDVSIEGVVNAFTYVVRYLFNESGDFIASKYVRFVEPAPDALVSQEKRRLLGELSLVRLSDIAVKPFSVDINCVPFWLIYSEETGSVDLEPGPLIAFMPPWDGEYYT